MEEQQKPQSNGFDLAMIFALVSLCLVVLYKVLTMFGVWSAVLFAIMGCVVMGLTITGTILAWLRDKKYSMPLLLNVALFFASLLLFV